MIREKTMSLSEWLDSFVTDEEGRERMAAGARALLNSDVAMSLLAEMERNLISGILDTVPGDFERLGEIHFQLGAVRALRGALDMIVDGSAFEEARDGVDFIRRPVSH